MVNFKSKSAYRKWLAYGHMHVKNFGKTPESVTINKQPHKVSHNGK